jgi:hypothetical protein
MPAVIGSSLAVVALLDRPTPDRHSGVPVCARTNLPAIGAGRPPFSDVTDPGNPPESLGISSSFIEVRWRSQVLRTLRKIRHARDRRCSTPRRESRAKRPGDPRHEPRGCIPGLQPFPGVDSIVLSHVALISPRMTVSRVDPNPGVSNQWNLQSEDVSEPHVDLVGGIIRSSIERICPVEPERPDRRRPP